MNDCAWCGTGEGICSDHLQALLIESKALAETGQYLARNDDNDERLAQATPQEREAERTTTTAS